MRKIIHVDMDAFFASVEQRDDPALAGQPVAVGGTSRRGVVAAASYEARAFGVRSAMPTALALRRCPDLILVKPRFEVYRDVSRQIRAIFLRYTDLVEPLSLDEAYLDVTQPKLGPPSATLLARQIKREILEETNLTASAGVSFNKFLAKVASDLDKPDGLAVILPEEAEAFIAELPVEKFYGVGPKTAQKMHALGIRTGADLRMKTEDELRAGFGKAGSHFYWIARARDERRVNPNRIRKSVGAERTFFDDADDLDVLGERLRLIAERVAERLASAGLRGRTVTLKVKYHDFRQITRARTLPHTVGEAAELYSTGYDLLCSPEPPTRPVRLLGLSVSTFGTDDEPELPQQLALEF